MSDEGFMDYFKLHDIIGRIERAEKPELEKIDILIEASEKFFSHLDFNLDEGMVDAYALDEDSGEWQVQSMPVEDAIKASANAFKKFAHEQALKNIEVGFVFYKKRYEDFVKVYKPYYSYTFELLKRVRNSMQYVKEGKKKQAESEQLKTILEEKEKQLLELENKNKTLNVAIENVQANAEKQLFNMQSYTDWLQILSDKSMISKPNELRIIAYLLVRGEAARSEMTLKLRATQPEMSIAINDLRVKGILFERKLGKGKVISLNKNYIESVAEKPQSRTESLVDKVAAYRRERELTGGKEEQPISEGLAKIKRDLEEINKKASE